MALGVDLSGDSNGSRSVSVSSGASAGSSMGVGATQVSSFASLCAGNATKIREDLYSLLVCWRSIFRLNLHTVTQIAAFHGCEHVVHLQRASTVRLIWLVMFPMCRRNQTAILFVRNTC